MGSFLKLPTMGGPNTNKNERKNRKKASEINVANASDTWREEMRGDKCNLTIFYFLSLCGDNASFKLVNQIKMLRPSNDRVIVVTITHTLGARPTRG